ncbi:acyl CoA:acetate/3-ketoacid CoA transferase [Erwinia sp. BNK-24-b]|uniref:acyl CoA:acetate/3-ketoacid CoA transferase n=1 Tax=unclassified Erwinia TaxID=2622719 RepID=UPI0039BF7136
MQVINEQEAARLLQDQWTVVPGGFGSCGHPDSLTRAIRSRFDDEGAPKNLSLLFASAAGDRLGKGVDALALPGLVAKAIGGFWGLVPALSNMATQGTIEAHNWPQGIVSQLFRAIASGKSGIYSKIGLETFVDPDRDGGLLNCGGSPSLVKKLALDDEQILFYPSIKIDCALLRGSCSDREGNISMYNEVSYSDALSQAMAAKNSGGIVIVQVEKIVEHDELQPHHVNIPGILVDYVVVAKEGDHPQTYGNINNPEFVTRGKKKHSSEEISIAEKIIARRALAEINHTNAKVVNLGIGIPALIGNLDQENNTKRRFCLTVESGIIGGDPASGLSFGASTHPDAIIEQAALFDFYEGGGLDLSCLGFAEVDTFGNINVSKFNSRVFGAGGFINITQSTKNILFCGTFTAIGLEVSLADGNLIIIKEGSVKKFVKNVSHLTFNGNYSAKLKQNIKLITERAVFTLKNSVIYLDEYAPGININTDIIANMDANVVISADCRMMDKKIFY